MTVVIRLDVSSAIRKESGTGRIQGLAIRTGDYFSARVRAHPDGKTAVAWGEPLGQAASSPGFCEIDLSSGSIRRLDPHGATGDAGGKNFTASLDGKSVLTFAHSGALTRIFRFSISGAEAAPQVLTVTRAVRSLDPGPGGRFYANIVDRPIDVVRFPPHVTRLESIPTSTQLPVLATMTGRL